MSVIGEGRTGAEDRVAERREIEELSKLKGPWKWSWLAVTVSAVLLVLCIYGGVVHFGADNKIVSLLVCFVVGILCFIAVMLFAVDATKNHRVWWCTEDKKLKVAAKDPMCATGLVIEAQIDTRPSVTLFWGVKRWKFADATHVCNKNGEVMLAVGPSANLEGLTLEIWGVLAGDNSWKIIPRESGRVLRLVDYTGLCRDIPCDDAKINLQEILSSRHWEEYKHKQAKQLVELQEKKARVDKVLDEVRERLLAFWDDVAERRVHPRITVDSTRLEYALLQLLLPLFFPGSSGNAEQNLARFDSVCAELLKFVDGRRRVENPFKLENATAPVADAGTVGKGEVRAS